MADRPKMLVVDTPGTIRFSADGSRMRFEPRETDDPNAPHRDDRPERTPPTDPRSSSEDPSRGPPILSADKAGLAEPKGGDPARDTDHADLANTDNPTETITRLRDSAKEFAARAKSQKTKTEYARDWQRFTSWCERHGVDPLPADPIAVASYVAHLIEQGLKPSTIERALVSISQAHKLAGYQPSPTSSAAVRETFKGFKREVGVARRQVAALVVEHIHRIAELLPDTLAGKRDRALLLIGFAGAFRRSELVALNVEDIEEVPEGIRILLRRSKTDQEGRGRTVGIPYASDPATCPVRALRAWLEATGIDEGPIFRGIDRHGNVAAQRLTGKAVALVVKRSVQSAGYDPKQFSGHSLRAGLATAAAAAGKSERSIMRQTGHRSVETLRVYIRDGELFLENAAEGLL